jgi:S-adenosylmethionine:tRNA ribosyltransferase-isomerase
VLDRAGTARLSGRVLEVEESGTRLVELSGDDALVQEVGVVPLPPYIHRPLEDSGRYQTVYAEVNGSVAALTAGLHFTDELLSRVRAMGVETVFVTLHVGWGSFRPVQAGDPREHEMRSEAWQLGPEAASAINRAKAEGRRGVSVVTTATRLLEQSAAVNESAGQAVDAGAGDADLFILPGFRFRVVDGLLANFHLPRSTLLMLVSAFAGRELVLRADKEAIEQRYRFYSFGDAMVVLQPNCTDIHPWLA